MKIKVCGITSVEQLQQLYLLGIEYAGLIFFKGSKRYAAEKLHMNKDQVRAAAICKVGVFVNAGREELLKAVEDFGCTAVQLHGDETPDFCRALMASTTVVKAFRLQETSDVDDMVKGYHDAAHYFLFDTDAKGYGGSGKKFNWQLLEQAVVGKPFFLSGGIGPADAVGIKGFRHPLFYGVDLNSRFESEPGCKDMEAVKKFVTEVGAVNAFKK